MVKKIKVNFDSDLQNDSSNNIERDFEIYPEETEQSQNVSSNEIKDYQIDQEQVVVKRKFSEMQKSEIQPKKEFLKDLLQLYKNINLKNNNQKKASDVHLYNYLLRGVKYNEIQFEIERLETLQRLANQGLTWFFNGRENSNNIKIFGLIAQEKLNLDKSMVKGSDLPITVKEYNEDFFKNDQSRDMLVNFTVKKINEILKRSDKIEGFVLNCFSINKKKTIVDKKNLEGCVDELNYLLSNLTSFELKKIISHHKDLVENHDLENFDSRKSYKDILEIFDGKSLKKPLSLLEDDFIKIRVNNLAKLYKIDRDVISKDVIEDLYLITTQNKPLVSNRHRDHLEGLRLNVTNAQLNLEYDKSKFDSTINRDELMSTFDDSIKSKPAEPAQDFNQNQKAINYEELVPNSPSFGHSSIQNSPILVSDSPKTRFLKSDSKRLDMDKLSGRSLG